MAKVYAIISGKGGVGKTTTAINLGICLNYLGEDVIIVDGNMTTPNIGIHLGAPVVPITLNHVLANKAKIEDAIYSHESGAKIIPASLSLKESEKVDYKKIFGVIKKLKKITNYIIIDSPAGLGEEVKSIINASDEIIVVTNPEISAVTDALKAIKLSELNDRQVKGVIITRYSGKNHEMPIANIKDMLEIPIIGIIPEDFSIKKSQALKNSVINISPKSRAAKSYIKTSRRILGENIELEYRESNGIIKRFLRSIGFGWFYHL